MRYRVFVLLVLQLCVFTLSFGQGVRQFHVNLDYNDFCLSKTGEGYSILSDRQDVVFKEDTLHPALPYVVISVLIAQNEDYDNCTIQGEDTVVANNIHIVPNPQPIQTDMPVQRTNHFQNVSYERRTYPEAALEYMGAQLTDGYKTLSFLVCPFSYDSSSRTLVFKRNISIRINTVIDKYRSTGYVGGNMREAISKMVINGEELDSLYSFSTSTRNLRTSSSVSYKYLIITNNSLKPAFEELVKWKTFKGVRSKIITIEEIASSYTGADLQEKIKQALIDYYNGSYSGLEYVLLGGDVNIVPARMCYIKCGSTVDTTPADMYYACLDDITWDSNSNGVYGEVEDGIEFSPELFVTRLPVRNISDASSYIRRVIAYERNPKKDFWHNNILMGGCKICSNFFVDGDSISDAQYKGEKCYNNCIAPHWDGSRIRFYDTATDLPGGASYQFNAENIQEQLSKGYNFVDILTHGNYTLWATEEGYRYNTNHASSLYNDGYTFILTKACNTNAFDKAEPCLSEAFLRNSHGGILGYIGCSRSNWGWPGMGTDPSDLFDEDFCSLLFSKDEVNFGKIAIQAKCSAYELAVYEGAIRWLMMGMNPLGDPEIPVYTDAPLWFGDISVNVENGTITIDSHTPGCRFCLTDTNDDDYYVIQNGSRANMRNDRNSYQVCITKPGYIPCTVIIGYNLFLQDKTIEGDVRYFSTNIAMGENVSTQMPQSPVRIADGSRVLISKKREALFDRGFSVEKGGTLEIKKW